MGLVIDARQKRVQQLLSYICKNGGEGSGVEVQKLVALLTVRWGITRKKVEEYLRELHTVGAIVGRESVKATKFGRELLTD